MHNREPRNPFPPETGPGPARVAELIRDIDTRDHPGRDLLLDDLLCAVWPTSLAQRQ